MPFKSHRHAFVFAAFVVAFVSQAGPARADEFDDQVRVCGDPSVGAGAGAERTIEACTFAIQSGRLPNDALADYYDKRAAAYIAMRDVGHAIEDYSQALAHNRKDVAAYNGRGLAYFGKHDFARAIADFDAAIALKPDDAQAYDNRGTAYYITGQFDRAERDFDEAIRLQPGDAYAHDHRGNAHYFKADLDGAIRDYDEAVRLQPDYAMAFYNRGRAYQQKGDYEHAIADYNVYTGLKPTDPEGYNARCFASAASGHATLAATLPDCNRALTLHPKDASALTSRCFLYFRVGRFATAIADCTAALRADPKFVSALYVRGLAKRHLHRAGADADLARAAQLNPTIANTFAGYGVRR